MNWLTGMGVKVWGYAVAAAATLAALAVMLRGAKKAGQDSVTTKVNQNSAETAARMAEAAAQAPKLGSEVAADARKGRF